MRAMIEYIPVILICNSLLSSAECKEGGRDVTIVMGDFQKTPQSCLMEGSTKVASLAFAPRQGENFYVKIKCVPRDTKEFGR